MKTMIREYAPIFLINNGFGFDSTSLYIVVANKNRIPKEGKQRFRSLKRSDRGKMLLVGAKVIKNQKVQKEIIVSVLGKQNVIAKTIPNKSKIVVMMSVLLLKKVSGKS